MVQTASFARESSVDAVSGASLGGAGLRFGLHSTMAGEISLPEIGDHRLKVHAGDPVRGSCRTQSFVYQRGDLDLCPAGLSDTWEEVDPSLSLMVHIAPWFLHRAAEQMGLDADRIELAPRHQFRDARIEHIAWALSAEHEQGQPSFRLYTESLGLALAAHLLGTYTSGERSVGGLTPRQRRRVVEHIESQLDQDLALHELAAVAGLGASHFKAQFKRSFGRPVHEYVVQRRVERAKTLLAKGVSISQVALEVGFAHPSHMARCMRKVLGVTPRLLQRALATGAT